MVFLNILEIILLDSRTPYKCWRQTPSTLELES